MIELTAQQFQSLHEDMIAGAIPLFDGNVDAAIHELAQDILDTRRVALIVARHDNHAYYIALPAATLASYPDFKSALTAALPSHPDHRGDGAYVQYNSPLAVALIKKGSTLRLLINTAQVIDDEIANAGLDTIDVREFQPWKIELQATLQRRAADQLSMKVTKFSAIYAATTIMLYVVSAIVGGAISGRSDISVQAQVASANLALANFSTVSPLSEQLARLQHVSSVAVRAGGWIEEYSHEKGVETFLLKLPEWVSKDYIDALGPGTVTERVIGEGLIMAFKRAP